MPITTDIDTFAKNYHMNNGAQECPICYDIIKEGKGVKCPNGHWSCEKHFIQRAKSMYESGDRAFSNKETTSQRCFMCRCVMPDNLFSNNYLRLVTLTQCWAIGKHQAGRTNLQCHAMWEHSLKQPAFIHLHKK